MSAESNEFDLVVIGGGSGGLACSKAAAELGARVAVLDFVKPSPQGTTWGLGGTCVNVGCIPKKLMHQAGLIGHFMEDAPSFGWKLEKKPEFSWDQLVSGVQDHIGGLNFGYRVALREKNVTYLNAYGTLLDANTIRAVDRRDKETILKAKNIVLAMGGRPQYPDIPGAREYGISSDDLFSLKSAPGKTLVIGASYVALECAGFLASLGYETAVMVRSILLRGFDSEIAERIGGYMADHGVRFIRPAIPSRIEKLPSGKLNVFYKATAENLDLVEEFDTVLFAIGREACTKSLGLEALGVELDPTSHKLVANAAEQSSVPNIYGIGDILFGKPELTPVAIHAGILLARRLFGGASELCDYQNIPTTVFTPLEYGCCGMSEDQAKDRLGEENIDIFLTTFTPLEWTVPHREDNVCFAKILVNKEDNKVVGFHILGPNAGEVTQGFGIALKLGATKAQFDSLIGIHPTNAEIFTTMSITKASGAGYAQKGC